MLAYNLLRQMIATTIDYVKRPQGEEEETTLRVHIIASHGNDLVGVRVGSNHVIPA